MSEDLINKGQETDPPKEEEIQAAETETTEDGGIISETIDAYEKHVPDAAKNYVESVGKDVVEDPGKTAKSVLFLAAPGAALFDSEAFSSTKGTPQANKGGYHWFYNQGKDMGVTRESVQDTDLNMTGDPNTSDMPVDYFGMKISGNSDSQIFDLDFNNPRAKVALLDKEGAYKTYAPMAEESGMDWSPEAFNQMYDAVQRQYVNYQNRLFDTDRNQPILGRRANGLYSEASNAAPYVGTPQGFRLRPEYDTRFVMENGQERRVMTDQEFVYNEVGHYIPITKEGTNKDENGKTYKDTEYHDVNLPGYGKTRMGNIADWEADRSSYDWFADPMEGSETMLVLDYDANGMPVAVERSMYEHGVDPNSIFTGHGPQEMHSKWYNNFVSKAFDWVDYTASDVMGFADALVDAGDYTLGTLGVIDEKDNYRWTDKSSDYWANYGKAYAKVAPNDVVQDGMWGSPQGFFYSFGTVMGSVMQMLGTKAGAAKSLKALANLGKLAKDGSKINKASKYLLGMQKTKKGLAFNPIDKYSGRIGSYTMASAAAGNFKRTLEENGVSDEAIWAMYGAAFAGSYLIERSGMNWLDDGLSQAWMRQEYKGAVDQGLKEYLKTLGKKNASELTKKEAARFGSTVWKNMLQRGKELGNIPSEIVKTFNRVPLLGAAIEEGREEVMEGLLYRGMESVHDMVALGSGFSGADKDYGRFA